MIEYTGSGDTLAQYFEANGQILARQIFGDQERKSLSYEGFEPRQMHKKGGNKNNNQNKKIIIGSPEYEKHTKEFNKKWSQAKNEKERAKLWQTYILPLVGTVFVSEIPNFYGGINNVGVKVPSQTGKTMQKGSAKGKGNTPKFKPNENGYFGEVGQSGSSKVRNMPGGDRIL